MEVVSSGVFYYSAQMADVCLPLWTRVAIPFAALECFGGKGLEGCLVKV